MRASRTFFERAYAIFFIATAITVAVLPQHKILINHRGPASEDCGNLLHQFLRDGSKRGEKIVHGYKSRSSFSLLKPVNPFRDWLRFRLQIYHGHPYPILAIDEAPRAYGYARWAVGQLDDERQALLEVATMSEELMGDLSKVEVYSKEVDHIIDQTAGLEVERRVLENELKKGEPFFKVQFPTVELDETTGQLVEKIKVDSYGSSAQAAIRLQEVKGLLGDNLLQKKLFRIGNLQKNANERGYQQALLLKKLETFRHEIIRAQTQFPDKELSDEVKTIFNRITSLYETEDAKRFKKEVSPPNWVWQKLKWLQLSAELKSVMLKDIPKLRDDTHVGKLVKYIASLSEDEKRALGLDKTAQSIEAYKKSKWIRLGIVAGTGGLSGAGGVTFVWNWLFEDIKKKETCAGAESTDVFVDCSLEYLRAKFPKQSLDAERVFKHVLNNDGEIVDKRIAREVADLLERRQKFTFNAHSKDAFSAPLRKFLTLGDMESPEYKDALMNILDDKEFKLHFLSTDPKVGYLMFKYADVFSSEKTQAIVESIVDAKPDDREALQKALKATRRNDPGIIALSDEVDEILSRRDDIIKAHNDDDKAKDAINKSVDASMVDDTSTAQ